MSIQASVGETFWSYFGYGKSPREDPKDQNSEASDGNVDPKSFEHDDNDNKLQLPKQNSEDVQSKKKPVNDRFHGVGFVDLVERLLLVHDNQDFKFRSSYNSSIASSFYGQTNSSSFYKNSSLSYHNLTFDLNTKANNPQVILARSLQSIYIAEDIVEAYFADEFTRIKKNMELYLQATLSVVKPSVTRKIPSNSFNLSEDEDFRTSLDGPALYEDDFAVIVNEAERYSMELPSTFKVKIEVDFKDGKIDLITLMNFSVWNYEESSRSLESTIKQNNRKFMRDEIESNEKGANLGGIQVEDMPSELNESSLLKTSLSSLPNISFDQTRIDDISTYAGASIKSITSFSSDNIDFQD